MYSKRYAKAMAKWHKWKEEEKQNADRSAKASQEDRDGITVLLVFDEVVFVMAAGPCAVRRDSATNRKSELRH